MGKGEITRTHLDNFPLFSSNLKLSSANAFILKESKICRLGKVKEISNQRLCYFNSFLNPFPNKPWFLHVCSTSLLKTLGGGGGGGERRKCLKQAISPFPCVFYSFGKFSAIFIYFKIVICKLF